MQTDRPGHTEYFIQLSLYTGWMLGLVLGTVSSPFVTVGPVPSLVPGWSPNDHQIDWTPSILHYIAFAKSVSVYVADGLQVAQPTNSIHLCIYLSHTTEQRMGNASRLWLPFILKHVVAYFDYMDLEIAWLPICHVEFVTVIKWNRPLTIKYISAVQLKSHCQRHYSRCRPKYDCWSLVVDSTVRVLTRNNDST